jgi:nitrite reductase/ring-hydroxylating ferredoxin subunit
MEAGVYLCNLDELAESSAKGFDPQGQGRDTLFVVRKGGKVVAYRDECPHYQGTTSLPWRKDAYLDRKTEFIVCAAHGAEFEIDSGLCVHGPCIGESLVSVALRIGSEGNIFLKG